VPDHKSRQTARIVEAALHVIHRDGLSGVSISKVAAEAGVTRQTVYNYFPDVESIVAHAVEHHAVAMERQLLDSMNRAAGPFGRVSAVADDLIGSATRGHTDLDLECGLSAEVRLRIAAHAETVRSALAREVAKGIEDGAFDRGLDPHAAADLLFGIADAAARAAAKHPNERSFLRRAALDAMWAAVRPAESPDRAHTS